MNKTEMAKKLAKKSDLSQAKAAEVIDIIFSSEPGHGIIAVELDADRDVSISGFGKFYTSRSRGRASRDPGAQACQVQAGQGPEGSRRDLTLGQPETCENPAPAGFSASPASVPA